MAQIGLGGLPFAETARSIELLATEIMPAVNCGIGAAELRNAGIWVWLTVGWNRYKGDPGG